MKKLIAILLVLFLSACGAAPAVSPDAGGTPPPPPPSLAPPLDFADSPADSAAPASDVDDGTQLIKWLIPVLLDKLDYDAAREQVDAVADRVNVGLLSHSLRLQIELRQVTRTEVPFFEGTASSGGQTRFVVPVMEDMAAILASQESYDLISLPTAHASITRLADMGLLRNIASDVLGYDNLRSALDEAQLDAIRYAGGIYGVPAGFSMRDDLAQSYLGIDEAALARLNIDAIDGLDDLLYAAGQAKSAARPYRVYTSFSPDVYRREYTQFPLKVSEDYLFVYTADGGVESYAGSDIARQDLDLAKRIWAVNDNPNDPFRSPVVLFDTKRFDILNEGRFEFANLLPNFDKEADVVAPVLLAPEKPRVLSDNPYGKICNVVPAHASAYGLMLLDLIYGDAELYQAFANEEPLFGIVTRGAQRMIPSTELVDLYPDLSPTRVGSGSARMPTAEQAKTLFDAHYLFTLSDCVAQRVLEADAAPTAAESAIDAVMEGGTAYQPMPWDGFTFDPMPVELAYARAYERTWGQAWEFVGNMRPRDDMWVLPYIVHGAFAYDDLAAIGTGVYDNGMQEVLEECRRQYAEFLQNKGWIVPAPSN